MNTVAIVGRPNVGKSTLFNRLISDRVAITDNVSGVTRDRIYGKSEWNGIKFNVIDTGGFVKSSDDVFEAAIREQVVIAIEEADVILFMVDVMTGITDFDMELAQMLRKEDKPVILVVNKVDNHQRHLQAQEFWSLGFKETYFLSSNSGSGTGDLLDSVVTYLNEGEEIIEDYPQIAIIGQPNVGKSSLTNALLGEERNIVTDVAGTTRDSIHSFYNKFDKKFYLTDTAGIRKKSKVHENLEFYSVMRAVKAIEAADVCLLMIDAGTGVESQDLNLFWLTHRKRRGIVILVNKWDLLEKETDSVKRYREAIQEKISPFSDVPILFISVLEKQRIHQAIEEALKVYERKNKHITTSRLNKDLLPVIERTPPPSFRGNLIKIKYISQLPLKYPVFAFYANHPKQIKANYKQFLENQIRSRYDFTGVPVSIVFKRK